MAPEMPGNLVVLDLGWKDSEVVCNVQRYDPISAIESLKVSWSATRCPPGYTALAKGVAYVLRPPGYEARDYEAQPPERGADLSWTDQILGDTGLMLIIVLPAGYVLPTVDDADPILGDSKEFNGRMALYWLAPQNEDRRQEFSWHMEKVQYTTAELKTRCSSLNHEAAERRRKANKSLPEPVEFTNPPASERYDTHSLLASITHWTFIAGILICLIGLAFIFVGASGNTNFTLFGQSFASTNIGIAAIFIGVVMIVINIGRVLGVVGRASRR